MKKCSRCGAVQKNSRMNCIDCGAPLGKPLDDKSEAALEDMLDDKLDGLSERAEDFYVPLRDRILAVVCIVGIVAAIVMLYLVGGEQDKIDAADVGNMYFSNNDSISPDDFFRISGSNSQRQREVNEAGGGAVTAICTLFVSAFMLLFPKVQWLLETLDFRFYLNADPSPSYLWLLLQKLGAYLCFAVGIGALIFSYAVFF